MKMPAKSRVLPSIAGALRGVGYDTEFLYGGDKNFTNMNSYFLATGYNRVLGDVDFPAEMRKTKSVGRVRSPDVRPTAPKHRPPTEE